jgi:antitoxin YefM
VRLAIRTRQLGEACRSVSEAFGSNRHRGRTTFDRGFLSSNNMTMILVMSEDTLPLAEVKKRLSEMVDRVEHHHDRVVLTRRGRPAAVLMSPDDLESLEETLDLLSTPGAIEEIRKAQAEIDSGLGIEADELRATYLEE